MDREKSAIVLGAGGFIGSHLVSRLKREGYFVRGIDLVHPLFGETAADEFMLADLRDASAAEKAIGPGFNSVFQLAADMGGAGYIFTGTHDASIMRNSTLINLNVAESCRQAQIQKLFFSSSACVYPYKNQAAPDSPDCTEQSAYPAEPDSEYGWEKLYSERLYLAYARNFQLDVKIGRLHNVFGPCGTWTGGREKVPAAICRKVAEAQEGEDIEIWGDGLQTRTFLYIDECLDGILSLMRSNFAGPVNIGSTELISINDLAKMVIEISGKNLGIRNVEGPVGVRGRTSDNRLFSEKMGWAPKLPLRDGITRLYNWVERQVENCNRSSTKYRSSELGSWA